HSRADFSALSAKILRHGIVTPGRRAFPRWIFRNAAPPGFPSLGGSPPMLHTPRSLVCALVLTFAACGTAPADPSGGAEPTIQDDVGPATANNCFEPWRSAGNMSQERYIASAVRLADGSVVVAGGYGNSGVASSAERFDPTTGTWSPAGTLN